jgi:hypothetical protein
MSDKFTSSSCSRRKAPALDPEDFASWEMMFQNYCGYQEWELFYEDLPEINYFNNFRTLTVKTLRNLAAT